VASLRSEFTKASPATAKAKAKFVLATDGDTLEAEDLASGETVACAYADFPNHFGFFLPLAGITTVKQLRDSSFDIRATSRLNRLYVELLKDNPEWGTAERRPDMNHFMARPIFCFFTEDTDIFNGTGLFTATIEQMSARDSSNIQFVDGAENASCRYVHGQLFFDVGDVLLAGGAQIDTTYCSFRQSSFVPSSYVEKRFVRTST
jgi:hypothetical protein